MRGLRTDVQAGAHMMIVLSGGHLGGETVDVGDPQPGFQMKFNDPTRLGMRKLVYEIREHQDEDGAVITGSHFAVFVGAER